MELEEKIKEYKTPLNYEGFEEYYFDNKYNKGKDTWKNQKQQWCFKFNNGYGASVIKLFGSYGFEDDLFELAVIKFTKDNEWELCYSTPITNDVIGYLSNDDVIEYLHKIQRLDENGRQ